MTGTHRTLTHEQFLTEAAERFGDPLNVAFRCPSCGDVATIREFPPEHRDKAGQECIGRSLGALGRTRGTEWKGRGCDWTAYGLIPGPWTITFPDRAQCSSFPFADAVKGVTP